MIKKLLIKSALFAIAALLPIFLYNYFTDCYSVLRRGISQIEVTPNDKFIKIEYILGNKDKYDSFIFGSSRAAHIHVHKLEQAKYYNMFFFAGIPNEWLSTIELLIAKKVRIKNIILAMDEFSYTIDPNDRKTEYLFQFYPVKLSDKIQFYYKYLTKQPDFIELSDMYKPIKKWGLIFDYKTTGSYYLVKLEKDIEANPEAHSLSRSFIGYFANPGNRIDDFIKNIKAIKKICAQNNINLTLLFNPINKSSYTHIDIDELNEAKRRLAGINSFWDFTGLNSVTTNNYYFGDLVHFRPVVGDMILSRIFGVNLRPVPRDFGILVTDKNIKSHLRSQKMQIDRYKKTGQL